MACTALALLVASYAAARSAASALACAAREKPHTSEREHPPTTKLSVTSMTWLLACRLPAWLLLELAWLLLLLLLLLRLQLPLLLLLPLLRLLADAAVAAAAASCRRK